MAKFIEKQFKSILLKRKFIDSWFWERYGMNPYQGCLFGCVYCDSRSAKYYLPEDFDNTVIVKTHIAEMLDKRISRARTLLLDVVGMASAADVYQFCEKKYRNTRSLLKVLLKYGYPVHIITKSTLVLEDLELIDAIAQKSGWATVSITITTSDEKTARFLEKRAPTPADRFNIIKTIKEKAPNIQAGVLLIPVVPYLSDSQENINSILHTAKSVGADYVLYGGAMTMRDNQALWFLRHIKEQYPELIAKYEDIYQFRYDPNLYTGRYTPVNRNIRLSKTFFNTAREIEMPVRIKRYIPDDYRRENYIIAEKLLNKAYFDMMQGKSSSYINWAGMNIQNLKESIRDVAGRGELRSIRNVGEWIEDFIRVELSKLG